MGRNGGFDGARVGITAARKASEQARMVADLGGSPVVGPTMRTVPLEDDPDVREAFEAAIADPPQVFAAITGVGTRGLVKAAQSLDVEADLLSILKASRRFARGPKARAALRELGLDAEWTPPSETNEELIAHLANVIAPGTRVMVQAHGRPMPEFEKALAPLGIDVVEVPVYVWRPPLDPAPGKALVGAIVEREIDIATFTSAPAARGLFALADEAGTAAALSGGLRNCIVASVGDVTSEALEDLGVQPDFVPSKPRMGIMYRELATHWKKSQADERNR